MDRINPYAKWSFKTEEDNGYSFYKNYVTGTTSEMSYHLILIGISKFLIFTFVDWEKLRLMEVTSVLPDARAISARNKISEIKHEGQR